MTLTTVGYGDIVPATDFARQLVSAEAVMGQVYLTIIVARLVGLHLSGSLRRWMAQPGRIRPGRFDRSSTGGR